MISLVSTWGYTLGLWLTLAVFAFGLAKQRSLKRTGQRLESFNLDTIVFVGFAAVATILTAIFASVWLYVGLGLVWGLTLVAQVEFIESRVDHRDFSLKEALRHGGWVAALVTALIASFLGPLFVPLAYWLRRK